jgi:hypothetical protein
MYILFHSFFSKTLMKKTLAMLLLCLVSWVALAQPSPAAKAEGKVGKANITINYAQPAVKGRKVWGELVPYNEVWRTGANKATTFEASEDISVEGKPLAKGKYALFTIPTESGEWTVIFNKKSDQWGSYSYKQEDDALRVKVKASKSNALTERLTFAVAADKVTLSWENINVAFAVK